MDYCIWRIDESEAELEAQLTQPALYADKVASLKPGSRRRLEVLATRRALKELLGYEAQVRYTPDGAPYLTEGPCLSISHTDGYAAVATDTHPVGIDIERRGKRVARVVSHFLKPEEVALVTLQSDPDLAMHLAWSAKEVAYKLLGRAYYDLQHLVTIQRFDSLRRTMTLVAQNLDHPLTLHYDFTDEYVMVQGTLDN